jgi:hypothetical protein
MENVWEWKGAELKQFDAVKMNFLFIGYGLESDI